MAVGGVFGVMNTMFASIAARIKEVGVLRILGFKRWQILISFMIESLTIALRRRAARLPARVPRERLRGREHALRRARRRQKSVTLTMMVDFQIIAAGMLFTLVMGRLGGLVPALVRDANGDSGIVAMTQDFLQTRRVSEGSRYPLLHAAGLWKKFILLC